MKIKIKPSEIKNLAPMSATISRLTNMVYDANASTSDMSRLIELDSALTANVLRWANSAFYGARLPVESVQAAVVRLGMNNIIRLAIGDCLAKPMKKSLPEYALVENELWRHNVAAALTVENIRRFITQPVHPAAFTAALLHDIGKLVLGRHLDKTILAEIQQLRETTDLPYVEIERQILETDHAEVGAAMAGYWKFPEELVQAIEKHHDSDPEPNNLLDQVLIANGIAKKIGVGVGMSSHDTLLPPAVLGRQGLVEDQTDALCQVVREMLRKAEEEWNML